MQWRPICSGYMWGYVVEHKKDVCGGHMWWTTSTARTRWGQDMRWRTKRTYAVGICGGQHRLRVCGGGYAVGIYSGQQLMKGRILTDLQRIYGGDIAWGYTVGICGGIIAWVYAVGICSGSICGGYM
jgi:hypothetical protein